MSILAYGEIVSMVTLATKQRLMQDQNVACRWTCARPSRNLASTRGDGKCRIDAHEIHTCLYNMSVIHKN